MHLTLKWKFILTLTLAILFPMALTTLVGLRVTSQQLEKQLLEESLSVQQAVEGELSRQISSADAIGTFMAELIANRDDLLDSAVLQSYLNSFSNLNGNMLLEVFSSDRRLLAISENDADLALYRTSPDESIITNGLDLESFKDYRLTPYGVVIKVCLPVVEAYSLETRGVVIATVPMNHILMQHIKSLIKAEVAIQWTEDGRLVSSLYNMDGTEMVTSWSEERRRFSEFQAEFPVQSFEQIAGKGYLVASKALIDNSDQVIGILSTALGSDKLNTTRSSMYRVIMISSAFFLFVAIGCGIIIARTITDPISQLVGKMRHVAQGDLSERIDSRRQDELGRLAFSFNEMTERLQVSFEKIAKQRNEIELLQKYLANIINSMPSVLIGVDGQGQITQWNAEAVERTGIPVHEALQVRIDKVFPQMSSKLNLIDDSIGSRTPHFFGYEQMQTPDGNSLYQNVTIYPLITNGVEGAVIRIDDVTKQYYMEVQLNQARKMDAIGELAGGVAHDFNNMLAGISGAAEMLALEVTGDGKRYLEIINNAAQRAAILTSKLLTFSRKSHLELTPLNLQKTVTDSIALLERTLDKKIEISCTIDASELNVVGNSAQLENCFINVGINAAQAMKDGGSLSFSVSNVSLENEYCQTSTFHISPGLYACVSIKDTGCGIPQENLKRIFEPFFTTKEHGKGTGLGLSAVYGIVCDHKGAIDVYSEVGVGTVFRILLPVSEKKGTLQEEVEEIIEGSGTILLADDEEVVRLTGRKLLEHLKYRVITAADGEEAVALFERRKEDIDLIILDIIMPKMNGLEAFIRIRELEPSVPVVIASGFSGGTEWKALRDAGQRWFITKPFRKAGLSQIVARALGRYGEGRSGSD